MVTTKARNKTKKTEELDATAELQRRLFTIDEYVRMADARILRFTERTELVEGEIYQMAAMGNPHAKCLPRVTDWSYAHRPANVVIRVQAPIRLSPRSLPEPDLLIVRYRADEYGHEAPAAEDALLLIEVSDTSLGYDLGIKQRIYAIAGIPDYWVFAIGREKVVVHRKPQGGRYTETFELGRGETVKPLAFPDIVLTVDEIFG